MTTLIGIIMCDGQSQNTKCSWMYKKDDLLGDSDETETYVERGYV
jgi:hypothetical protein